MKGFVIDLKETAKENAFFRRVLYTGEYAQLVTMSLEREQEIGLESHAVDQFFYAVDGEGTFEIAGESCEFEKGDAVFVPAGVEHNVVNTGDEPLQLFTLYAPPQHPAGTVQESKPAPMTVPA